MNGRVSMILTFSSALGSGLMAGLFFAFSICVMAALSKIPSEQGIAAMQSINSTILNPLFSLVFMGTALLSVGLGVLSIFRWGEPGMFILLAGSLFYLIGIVVTMVVNVPMNDALAAVKPGSSSGADLWAQYIVKWTTWNHIRTIACLAALVSFIITLRARG